MFNNIRGRPRTQLNSLSRAFDSARYASGFFKDNFASLFGIYDESGRKLNNVKVNIKPIERVAFVDKFYSNIISRGVIPRGLPTSNTIQKGKLTQLVSPEIHSYDSGIRNRPVIGSFVEIQKANGDVDIGIVKSAQSSLLRPELSMINVQGNVVQFKPTEISFHLYKMMDSEKINKSTIKDNVEISAFLKEFVRNSHEMAIKADSLYTVAQAWYAKENAPVEVDLGKIVEIINRHTTKKKEDPFDISALAFAVHRKLTSDPINWFVESNPHKLGNDSLPYFKYYSNSYKTIEHLEIAMKLKIEHVREISKWLNSDFVGDEREKNLKPPYTDSVIELLKHFVVYPHPCFKKVIDIVWNEFNKEVSYTATDIKKLVDILSDESCDFFDSILPARIYDNYSKNINDHFSFMREPITKTVFGIPNSRSQSGGSDIAISVEKNKDNWILELHVLDLGSHINPKSSLANLLLQRVESLQLADRDHSLFNDDAVSGFREGYDVSNSAITLTIKYPLDARIGWDKAELLSIDLTSLHDLKLLSIEDINNLIKTRAGNIFKLFRNSTREDFTSEDEDHILSSFKIIELWNLWRSSKESLEYQFHKKVVENGELIEKSKSLEYVEFLRREINYLISNYMIPFTQEKKCPLLIHSQSSLSPMNDSIKVYPNKFSIPAYMATEYKDLTLFPNDEGHVSFKSYICGLKFLENDVVSTHDSSPYVSKGLFHGLIKFIDPFNDMEVILNQWQVINMLKARFKFKQGYNIELNQHLQDFKMKDAKELQQIYTYKLKPIKGFNQALQSKQDRMNKLTWLSQKTKEWLIFKCIITESSSYPDLAKAYCFELDLEIEILLNPEINQIEIGDQLICTKIIKLDLIESRLVLQS